MIYQFEIKQSDMSDKHWLIVKREEKSDGYCFSRNDLNRLRVAIQNYLDNTESELESK